MPSSPAATPCATPTAKERLYDEDGKANPAFLSPLRRPLHQLFAHWVHTHHHERDFIVAVEHTALALYADYLLGGAPAFLGETLPDAVLLPVPGAPLPHSGARVRLYDDQGDLAPSPEALQLLRSVLAPLFLGWAMQPRVAREFVLAVHDVAVSLCYDYSICQSLGGLGGGLTAEQFMTAPFAPA